ncbi:hypothetical protein Sango_3017900 [Sesamum angolense]|uniref:Integrase catalytic domain-containing protein n=1 Tax=Sesamum angolense TaxID=2727404 RepID=A0AAE1T496_9LAMI|nr:hypothetical protein Sango_3017900 [Sesamum angolense]
MLPMAEAQGMSNILLRIGHVSKDRIRKLVDSKSLEIDDLDNLLTCESYLKGKMTKKPFDGQNVLSNGLLDLIHIDVCGPLNTPARGGFSYFMTFTDDHSRCGYVYLMRYKFEAFRMFKEYRLEVENQTGHKIKAIRSDQGGEYLSGLFIDYLKENEIFSQWAPYGTPQLNGVVERRNRTLLDMSYLVEDSTNPSNPKSIIWTEAFRGLKLISLIVAILTRLKIHPNQSLSPLNRCFRLKEDSRNAVRSYMTSCSACAAVVVFETFIRLGMGPSKIFPCRGSSYGFVSIHLDPWDEALVGPLLCPDLYILAFDLDHHDLRLKEERDSLYYGIHLSFRPKRASVYSLAFSALLPLKYPSPMKCILISLPSRSAIALFESPARILALISSGIWKDLKNLIHLVAQRIYFDRNWCRNLPIPFLLAETLLCTSVECKRLTTFPGRF